MCFKLTQTAELSFGPGQSARLGNKDPSLVSLQVDEVKVRKCLERCVRLDHILLRVRETGAGRHESVLSVNVDPAH